MWIKNSLYQLIPVERDILGSENKWLTNNIIFASLNILKVLSSISGFQDPILGLSMVFSTMRSDFTQILHDEYGHWFTISNIEVHKFNEVLIYDSMLHSLGDHERKQVAALLACPEKNISIKVE